MKLNRILFIFLTSCLFGIVSNSQVAGQGGGVGMVTGSKTGTYIKFGHEIAEQAKKYGVNIIVKESEGSIDNIERLASKENAAFAIVQSDVLGYLKRHPSAKAQSTAEKLRLIFPFYNEEVHLFANKRIRKFDDLNGKRVVIGSTGSGTYLTAINLLKIMNVEPGNKIEKKSKEGVFMVLKDQADAVFYVAGKPVTLFNKINNVQQSSEYSQLVDNVHFVPLNDPRMLQEYVPSWISSNDYAWFPNSVETIAVKAALVCFDFSNQNNSYYDLRCKQISKIAQAIRDNIENLKRSGHPKWKEVNFNEDLGIWKKDSCSGDSLRVILFEK